VGVQVIVGLKVMVPFGVLVLVTVLVLVDVLVGVYVGKLPVNRMLSIQTVPFDAESIWKKNSLIDPRFNTLFPVTAVY
jgi:hypothetical protein